MIVLRSVNDVNLPKFTVEDLPLFRGITSDLFPGVVLPEANHGALIPTIDEVCRAGVCVAPDRVHTLQPVPGFTKKVRGCHQSKKIGRCIYIVAASIQEWPILYTSHG